MIGIAFFLDCMYGNCVRKSLALNVLLQGKGYDTLQHVLACFGGAGGQHACAVARSLGMSTVFIHR